jgi:hypothetical protein
MAYKIIDLPAVGRNMIGTDLFELSLVGGTGSKKITGAEISAGIGAVTSVTATSPILSSGGLTPDISIPQATVSVSGYLSATDWSTFNGKQNSLTFGNLTETISSVLTITGGTGAVIGSGASIEIKQSGAAQSGYLSSTDWNTFNNKKSTYMMVGMFTNLFGGDPGGIGKDILEWSGVATPAASHSSALPILQNCKITAAGFKWISSSPVPVIGVGDSWNVQVFKMTNPLTGSTTADGNFTLVGNLNITLDSTSSGTTPGIFSSGLALTLNAGDIIRIAGVETGVIATGTDEAQLTVLFEVI